MILLQRITSPYVRAKPANLRARRYLAGVTDPCFRTSRPGPGWATRLPKSKGFDTFPPLRGGAHSGAGTRLGVVPWRRDGDVTAIHGEIRACTEW